ncbi:MAG: TolC family protein [Bryobacterales bacterium]|nr:TolC family protein [Bryobacterales bacterium]
MNTSISPRRHSGNRSKMLVAGQAIAVCGLPCAPPAADCNSLIAGARRGPGHPRFLFALIVMIMAATSYAQAPPTPPASQVPAAPRLNLGDLERMALQKNPVLRQADANNRAAAGRAHQAGLYPNPTIAAVGEEISGGPVIRGGEFGGGFSQRIVTAGKLGLSRRIAQQDQHEVKAEADAQKYRVLSAVRSLYYQALGDQRLIEVRTELAKLARRAVDISRELANVGQADRPDLLAAEIEADRIELELISAANARQRTWRQLASVVNDPSLKPVPLAGDLDSLPKLELDQALETIYSESPELRAANVGITRAELALRRAEVEKFPDLMVSGGVRYNRELLEQSAGGRFRPVGREGFFDIGIQIPLFDRNQGNVAAARAELERSRLDVDRTKLALRARLAVAYKEYQDAVAAAERYRTKMIPKAQQAYELYLNSFRQMAAAYPQALVAQRNLFQLQDGYVRALVNGWQRSIEIQGLLLGDSGQLMGPRPVTE